MINKLIVRSVDDLDNNFQKDSNDYYLIEMCDHNYSLIKKTSNVGRSVGMRVIYFVGNAARRNHTRIKRAGYYLKRYCANLLNAKRI